MNQLVLVAAFAGGILGVAVSFLVCIQISMRFLRKVLPSSMSGELPGTFVDLGKPVPVGCIAFCDKRVDSSNVYCAEHTALKDSKS